MIPQENIRKLLSGLDSENIQKNVRAGICEDTLTLTQPEWTY